MKRSIREVLFITVIAVVFAVTALVLLFRLSLETYRNELESALTDSLGVEVTISRLSLAWTTGPVLVVDGLMVEDPRLVGDYILYVPRVKTRLALRSLFGETLIVSNVSMSMPDLHLTEYRNGMNTWDLLAHTNRSDRLQTSSKTPAFSSSALNGGVVEVIVQRFLDTDIIIERLTIDDGSLFYRHEKDTGVVTSLVSSRGIDATLTLDGALPIRSLMETTDPLTLIAGSMNGSIDRVDIKDLTFEVESFSHSIEKGIVTAKRISVKAYEGTFDASGTIDMTDPSFPTSLTLEVTDLAIHRLLNTFSDEKDLVVGTFTADGRFVFSARSPSTIPAALIGRGEYAIVDGYVTDFSIRKELADAIHIPEFLLPEELDTGAFDYLGGSYRVGNERVWFDDSHVTAPTYTATSSGYVGFDKSLDFTGEIYPTEEILETTKLQRLANLSGNENLFRVIPFTVYKTIDDVEFDISLNSPFLTRLLDALEQFGIEF
ncbi:MAG: AsmA family protein [Deltaproteobacteria bacterium]|nr:AsmA family protein [Candidatus Zymogenaceae bacterium]